MSLGLHEVPVWYTQNRFFTALNTQQISSQDKQSMKKGGSPPSVDKPVCQRCTTCGPAACWSQPLFPLTPVCLEQTPRCHHMADKPAAHCCGIGDTTNYTTSRRGVQCHVVSATPTSPMSGWPLRPHCEELKGHLERKIMSERECHLFTWKNLSVCVCVTVDNHTK